MNSQTETIDKATSAKVDAIRFVAIVLAYFITGRLGLEFATIGSNISLIWLPTGIAVAALFRWGRQYWSAVWLSALLVNLAVDTHALIAFGISVGNTLAPLLTVSLLRRWHFNPDISNWRDVPIFAISGAVGMMLSALGGVTVLDVSGELPLAKDWALLSWWLGDTVGVIVGGTVLITFNRDQLLRQLSGVPFRVLLFSMSAVVVVGLTWVFIPEMQSISYFLLVPLIVLLQVWIGLVLGTWPAAVTVLILSTCAAWALAMGRGHFFDPNQHLAIVELWIYMTTLSITTMLVSAIEAERKQLENQLRNISDYTRNLIEVSLDPLVTIDANGKITDVNKATETAIGFSRKQLINSDFSAYFTDPDQANQAYLQAFSQGHITDYPLVIKHHDGHLTDVLYNATVYRNEHGEIAGVLACARNITELKQAELAKRASEDQLRTFYELDLVGLTITSPDKAWIRINDCLCKMLEYSENELRGMTWVELTYPEDLTADAEQFDRLLANEINGYTLQKRFISRTGKVIPTHVVVRCVRKPTGEVDYVMSMVEDMTEYKKTEAELRIAAAVFEAQEGMLVTDANLVILNVNRTFTHITGYSKEELVGQTPDLLRSNRHEPAFYEDIQHSIYNTGAWHGEIWNRRKNGEVYPQQLTITAVTADNNEVTHYVATMMDITERKVTEEYINRLAFYDSLTQLPNRRLLQQRIKHGIEMYHRTGNAMAVLMMDLDKFKTVNDTYGHAAGDELLQQVAKRIKARLRGVDMVARLGGDEFVVLIENFKNYDNLANIANSIIQTLAQMFTLRDNHYVFIGASIGIAIYPKHGDSEETLMDNADIALYHAKARGRGCFVYFSDTLSQQIKERATKETRLRHAIEHHELQIFFQPQTEISTGRVVGAEALVLWYQPTHGYFMPKEFLDIAEDTGLIVNIGEWLLRETCRLGRQWLDAGLPPILLAVNISPYQFRHTDVRGLVSQVLQETGFPVEYLALEITEAGLVDNHDYTQPILNTLHEQGVHLVIDNFGKGYSSLTYLKHFPLAMLKIDKSFIDDLPFSQDDCDVAASIIAMAHHLGFKVLAEGVETVPQLDFLREQDCDKYQGVHSQALPVNEFEKLLLNLKSVSEKDLLNL